jgi:uncharacterized protein YwgA
MEKREIAAITVDLCEKLDSFGSWCGETHVQKAFYFVQDLMGVPAELVFVLYKYGPFSFDLRDDLNVMITEGLLALRTRPYPYGPSLASTSAGLALRDASRELVGRYSRRIEFVAERLGNKGVADLERLATALFVLKERGGQNWSGLETRIHELKPHVSPSQAALAVQELRTMVEDGRQLGLV